MVHQILRQPVPAGDLISGKVVIHATKLKLNVTDIKIKRNLQEFLLDVAVAVVAARVLDQSVQPVAEILVANLSRSAQFRTDHTPVPGTDVNADGARSLGYELTTLFDTCRLGIEVDIATDFGWTMDWRCRPAHNVDTTGGA